MGKNRKTGRVRELAVKGMHLVLRQFAMSPEMVQARILRRSVERHVPERTPLLGRKVLIPSMRDWASHVHLEALLGHYLRSNGAVVRHLSCGGGLEVCDRANSWEAPPMPCRSCASYVSKSLKAHRVPVTWLRDSYPHPGWKEIDSMRLEELMAVEWNGYPLGSLVEVPVKWFLLAETLREDPLATQTYRMFLRSARRVVEAMEKNLETDPPDQVVLLNGLFMFEAVLWEVCRRRNIPVISYERAFIVDSYVFAHDRVSSFYVIDDAWEVARAKELNKSDSAELDEYLLDRRTGMRTSDDYWKSINHEKIVRFTQGKRAVLFTNLVWDSAVLGQDIAFPSIVDWLVTAVATFATMPEHELVVRIHPAETKLSGRESRERMQDSLMRRIDALPPNVQIIPSEDDTSSYDLMESADFGLVYSSTTGLEMALTGKPVIVAAQTHYRGKGFTIDVSTPDEFLRAVTDLALSREVTVPNLDLARRYAHLFFLKTPFFQLGVSEPMRGLVKFDSTSLANLLNGGRGDVKRFLHAVETGNSFNL